MWRRWLGWVGPNAWGLWLEATSCCQQHQVWRCYEPPARTCSRYPPGAAEQSACGHQDVGNTHGLDEHSWPHWTDSERLWRGERHLPCGGCEGAVDISRVPPQCTEMGRRAVGCGTRRSLAFLRLGAQRGTAAAKADPVQASLR